MSYLISVLILHLASVTHTPAPKYWIEFRDKGISRKHFSAGNPVFEAAKASLSQKCLDRRSQSMHEPAIKCISLEDAPISARYINALRKLGIRIEARSKWSNAVSARLTSSDVKRISSLKFVRAMEPVGSAKLLSTQPRSGNKSSLVKARPLSLDSVIQTDSTCGYNQIIYHYGGSQSELSRINVWPLHAMGFDGSGVLLGFLDDGMRWTTTSCTEHCKVISQYDYILHDSIVWMQPGDSVGQDSHGTTTLGTAMGYLPDTLIGPAFNASVMLAETEVAITEQNVEEDNYANALEDMEAKGVDITSSSLGYFAFDSGQHSYTYPDMNGHTTICTQAVERAAKLGILVVTAMGNGGDKPYPYVQAPGDADSILACGALNEDGSIANFSSRGPTSNTPPRIKPDICAPGVNCWIENSDGTYSGGADGTSYATPLTSGACCLIKQAHPEATAQQIRHAVMITGANATAPDTAYGWGEINAYAAALELGTIIHPIQISVDSAVHLCFAVASKYPIGSVSLYFLGDTFSIPQTTQFNLAADSLIYSCTIPDAQSLANEMGSKMFYKIIVGLNTSGPSIEYPPLGWNLIALPAPNDVSVASKSPLQNGVYPNPCSSQFELNMGKAGDWQLIDATGNKILDGRTSATGTANVSTTKIANGSYYVRFTGSDGVTKVIPLAIAH